MKPIRIFLSLCCAASIVVLQGCATPPAEPLTSQNGVTHVVIGKSTAADVMRLLGAPRIEFIRPQDRAVVWDYGRIDARWAKLIPGIDMHGTNENAGVLTVLGARHRALEILFDSHEIVRGISTSAEARYDA